MAASKAGTGAGAVLKINTVSTTYVPVAQLKTFSFSGQKWALDDVTNAASPAAGGGVIKEQLPSILDYGQMDVSGVWLYNDAGQVQLMTNFNGGVLTNFKMILALVEGETTTQTEYDFAAYITDMPVPDISFDKSLTFKASLKLNAIPTITAGA
jgi:hypothetical protein